MRATRATAASSLAPCSTPLISRSSSLTFPIRTARRRSSRSIGSFHHPTEQIPMDAHILALADDYEQQLGAYPVSLGRDFRVAFELVAPRLAPADLQQWA